QTSAPLTLSAPPTPPFVATDGTATYTASASGGPNLRYQWDFGDGTTSGWLAAPSITHTYAAPGLYTVTVIVTDDSGAVQSRSFTQAVYRPTTARVPAASGNLLVEQPAGGNPRLWVVNQDNDSITAFDAVTRAKLGE